MTWSEWIELVTWQGQWSGSEGGATAAVLPAVMGKKKKAAKEIQLTTKPPKAETQESTKENRSNKKARDSREYEARKD